MNITVKFKSAEDKINYCWKSLGIRYPFYRNVISEGIRFENNDIVQTAGIVFDRMVIYWNREFIDKLTQNQCEDILHHEILHHIMMHDERYKRSSHKDLSQMAHNVAMDLEINCMIPNMFEHCKDIGVCNPQDKDFGFPLNLSYEEYLELMVKKDPQGLPMSGMIIYDPDGSKAKDEEQKTGIKGEQFDENGKPIDGSSADNEGKAGSKPAFTRIGNIVFDHNGTLTKGSGSDLKKMRRQNISEQTLRDRDEYMKSNGIGNGSNYSNCVKTKIKKIKYPWYRILRDLIINKCPEIISGDTYETYSKLNRYKVNLTERTGVVYRGFYDEVVEYSIAIIMDVSGSMGELTDKMYGILKSIGDEFDDKLSIDILETDSEVRKIFHNFEPDNSLVDVSRGGGTDMESALDFIKKNKLEYDFHVIMTDNEVSWSGRKEFLKNTIVLSTDKNNNCPYKQYEVTFK